VGRGRAPVARALDAADEPALAIDQVRGGRAPHAEDAARHITGGVEEDDDETPWQTAVRETQEELGIPPEDVRLLGALTPLTTVTDFFVEPFVGAIPYPHVLAPAEAEIAEVLDVPVAALLDPKVLETRLLPGREEPTLFYHYGPSVIWGATARMLKELLDALR